MPRREKFEQSVDCEKCKKTGTAKFDEFENPVFAGGNLDTHLLSVTAGFELKSGKIVCVNCKSVVWTPNYNTNRNHSSQTTRAERPGVPAASNLLAQRDEQ